MIFSEKWKVKSEEWKIALTQLGFLSINKTTKQQDNQTTWFLVKSEEWTITVWKTVPNNKRPIPEESPNANIRKAEKRCRRIVFLNYNLIPNNINKMRKNREKRRTMWYYDTYYWVYFVIFFRFFASIILFFVTLQAQL